jgi:hypothetical protein
MAAPLFLIGLPNMKYQPPRFTVEQISKLQTSEQDAFLGILIKTFNLIAAKNGSTPVKFTVAEYRTFPQSAQGFIMESLIRTFNGEGKWTIKNGRAIKESKLPTNHLKCLHEIEGYTALEQQALELCSEQNRHNIIVKTVENSLNTVTTELEKVNSEIQKYQ